MATLYSYFESASGFDLEPKKTFETESDEESDKSVYPPSQKVYKRAFSRSWLEKFVWLRYESYDEDLHRMYCKYCEQSNKDNTYTSGCKNFRISDIKKHSRSRDHSAATEAYLSKTSGATVTAALSRSTTINEEGVMAALRNIYWLAKEDLASLKYTSLNELTKLQGCDSITHLYVGENAKYTKDHLLVNLISLVLWTNTNVQDNIVF